MGNQGVVGLVFGAFLLASAFLVDEDVSKRTKVTRGNKPTSCNATSLYLVLQNWSTGDFYIFGLTMGLLGDHLDYFSRLLEGKSYP